MTRNTRDDAGVGTTIFKAELQARRTRLQQALEHQARDEVDRLLREVDAALDRLDGGRFGLCEICHEPIESDRLLADPLLRFCLDHLTPDQKDVLEQDLQTAASIQQALLPHSGQARDGWESHYVYLPGGMVSGDYLDLIPPVTPGGDTLFLLGDVSGKGVSAAMLMANLQAMFRTLAGSGMTTSAILERANRMFCDSTLPSHYATIIAGRSSTSGGLEVCNAGHPPALLLRDGEVTRLEATGLPLGMFCDGTFGEHIVEMGPSDVLLLYTDGVSESEDPAGTQYGTERLVARLEGGAWDSVEELLLAVIEDLRSFSGTDRFQDDTTLLCMKRTGPV